MMKKVLRWLLASVLFFVVAQAIAMGVYGALFPNYYQGYEAFRPMSSLHFRFGLPLVSLMQSMVISLLYAVFYKGIPGAGILKGIVFGFLLWLMTGCGIVLSYCTTIEPFPVPCLVQTLAGMIVGGMVISAVYGKVGDEVNSE
ncbi:MAG: hypothetical protein HY808_05770 [Nitrospirae bacterium]|nr:hypothetical protein [Nitrospirota bacterium]